MTLTPVRGLLGMRKPFAPAVPDNRAENCYRCPHSWHGLECRTSGCPCSSSWVDPSVIARIRGRSW